MKSHLNKFVIVALLLVTVLCGATSCKSKKKAAQAKAAAEAQYINKVNNAKDALKAIINGETTLTTLEKETKLNSIKKDDLHDAELSELIAKVEEMIENERKADSSNKPTVKAVENNTVSVTETDETRLNKMFDNIASGNEVNKSIGIISEMVESNDVPVLIIISKNEMVTDYDRPTTIGKYIDYLKDQNVSRNKVYNIMRNANNKISEIELIRK